MRHAEIIWGEDGLPRSAMFGDVYFSPDNGLEETRHVFLSGNGLPTRWQESERFTIAETGFGTGLNFLATWQCWRDTAPEGAQLDYISLEGYPLRKDDLVRALALWPDLAPLAEALLAIYPPAIAGCHRLFFEEGRVRLTLLYGEAGEILPDHGFLADAWYLDGFAPSKNPDFWDDGLLEQVAGHTAPGGSFATYTVAGAVRRALGKYFDVAVQPGFGRKREMLTGTLMQKSEPVPASGVNPFEEKEPVLIIGAGLAGLSAAHALSRRGIMSVVLEAGSDVAMEASGAPCAISYPRLDKNGSPATEFYMAAYLFLLRLLETAPPDIWRREGLLDFPKRHQREGHAQALCEALELPPSFARFCTAQEAGERAGVAMPAPALFLPDAVTVEMPALCGWLASASYILPRCYSLVGGLRYLEEEELWQVRDAAGEVMLEASRVILAAGWRSFALLPEEFQPSSSALIPVRGQITHLPETEDTARLRHILCYGGYLTPARGGVHHLGTTFEHHRTDTEPDPASDAANREALARFLPSLVEKDLPESSESWAGIRGVTPDRLPMIGEIAPGLYLSAGHGARGLLSCPLAGEWLAGLMTHTPLPVSSAVQENFSPQRFLEPSGKA